jgi:hypothetical protein
MYKGRPHLVYGDVGISPYHRPSGELDARGSVRVRVGGCGVRRRPEVLCRGISCRVVSYRIVSYRIVSCRVVSCRVVSCRVVSYRVVSCRWWYLHGLSHRRNSSVAGFYHVGDGGRGWRCSSCYQCVAHNVETGALRVCSRERLG